MNVKVSEKMTYQINILIPTNPVFWLENNSVKVSKIEGKSMKNNEFLTVNKHSQVYQDLLVQCLVCF